jgi:hypothetical protein
MFVILVTHRINTARNHRDQQERHFNSDQPTDTNSNPTETLHPATCGGIHGNPTETHGRRIRYPRATRNPPPTGDAWIHRSGETRQEAQPSAA